MQYLQYGVSLKEAVMEHQIVDIDMPEKLCKIEYLYRRCLLTCLANNTGFISPKAEQELDNALFWGRIGMALNDE